MSEINQNALQSEIRLALINGKVNACPMAVRVAWHAAGTFSKEDNTGGTNGATMRFAPEANDPANAGLSIIRDMLHPVQVNNPGLSAADLWVAAGASAIEFSGGPKIPIGFGRTDAPDESYCPPNGRLPDASQGAEHIRQVFYRMGFNDREIVALSGAHTLGRCHSSRSGFDGPWTSTPLTFNNEYFKNLVELQWQPRKWDGPLQYEDVATQKLMMLPSDMALINDPEFAVWTRKYAEDQNLFFEDFSAAFSKLLALNTPPVCSHFVKKGPDASDEFRENAMHGSLEKVQQLSSVADVHAGESSSGRTALHKAAYWGHAHVVDYLIDTLHLNVNAVDFNGDTPLHDAARFAHDKVVEKLIASGADLAAKNKAGQTPLEVAVEYSSTSTANKHDVVIQKLRSASA